MEQHRDGSITLSLEGADFYTQSLFADAMEELLGPIDNPRYLISRQRKRRFWQQRDYHAVPAVLGNHKDKAMALHQAWKKRLGRGELIYTRVEEGRRLLLQARARAFSWACPIRANSRTLSRSWSWPPGLIPSSALRLFLIGSVMTSNPLCK